MNDKIVDTLENLIALNEAQAPLEDIDAAVIEARRVLDDFLKDSGTMNQGQKKKLIDWMAACPDAEFTEITKIETDGSVFIVSVDCAIERETS
jgi:hypothetical protein